MRPASALHLTHGNSRSAVFRRGARPDPAEVSAFVDERRCDFGVELICHTLGVSASGYYQRATGERSARVVEDERLLAVITATHTANYEAYGSRRMWKALRRLGEQVGRGRVERLMAASGLCGAKRRGKPWRTTIQAPDGARSPDLVERDFSASRPDEKWFADFTYVRCWEGVVFFSFVIDCYSRMVVGWQFAGHMRTSLVGDALDMAVAARRPDRDRLLIHHSDRGVQGGFKWSSQRLIEEGLRWVGRFGRGSVRGGR